MFFCLIVFVPCVFGVNQCKLITSRDLPASWVSARTNKPIFHDFGHANVHPAAGGLVYGDYLKTHNVHSEVKQPYTYTSTYTPPDMMHASIQRIVV